MLMPECRRLFTDADYRRSVEALAGEWQGDYFYCYSLGRLIQKPKYWPLRMPSYRETGFPNTG
jgi:hypothetical protein